VKRVDVVIIDDDEGIRWVLQQTLEMGNFSCVAVNNAIQGINTVMNCHPRLAIVDIKLGAVNGFKVARMIRQIYDDVKILFMTGYKEAITEPIEVDNVVGVLEKPFDVEELLQLVAKTISRGSV
jgi:two-component system response regulator (stage 0 sporulation protein F)